MKSAVVERIKSLFHHEDPRAVTYSTAVLRNVFEQRKRVIEKMGPAPDRSVVRLLQEIDAAVDLLAHDTYGRCEVCGEDIAWVLLQVDPLRRYCPAHMSEEQRQKDSEHRRVRSLIEQSPEYPGLSQSSSDLRKLARPAASAEAVIPGRPAGYEVVETIGQGGMGTVYRGRKLPTEAKPASTVQPQLLPEQNFAAGPWKTSYSYTPAGTVSGDYCDLIRDANGDAFFFGFGDGMGSGIGASILSTLLYSLFRAVFSLRREEPLVTLIEHANRLLCEELAPSFCAYYASVICGRGLPSGAIELVNAGHPPALLISSREPVQLESSGIPLGLFYTSSYETAKVELQPGDALLLYTDGITEAENAAGTFYGLERLLEVAQKHAGAPAEELVNVCLEDVKRFSGDGPASDDRTILVIRRS